MERRCLEGFDKTDGLRIEVADQVGAGGAFHRYIIKGYDAPRNPSFSSDMPAQVGDNKWGIPILFQNGPIGVAGPNGITNEALLAIVIDRLKCFQSGPFANDFNERALRFCEEAVQALEDRTADRQKRGVEGTNQI